MARLRECGVLDSARESEFDQIVNWASDVMEVPIALISLVDENRQWFKARCGLGVPETPRAVSFCGHAIAQDGPLVIEDSRKDARFANNPLVTGEPHVVFYAGFPIRVGGFPLGTLCLIDHKPRQLLPGQRSLLMGLAQQVALQLEWRRALRVSFPPLEPEPPTKSQAESELLAAQKAGEETEVAKLRARLGDVEQLLRSQQATIEELKQLRLHKDQLASHVVHDLKNPLTAIVANAYLIRRSEEFQESANDILLAADAMQRMVSDLLDLAASEARHLRLRRCPTHLPELFAESCRVAGGAALVHSQTISVSTDNLVDPWLDADTQLLKRVIQNLLDNGAKYSPPRSSLRLEAWDEPGSVQLSVQDEGAGIPAEERERIFELYSRLGSHADHPRTSQGLGLAFCKMAVEAHGGRIWVEDACPAGACFRVELPRA